MNRYKWHDLIENVILDTNFIIYKFWAIFCGCIFLASLVIKALYNMEDFPYFVQNKGIDIIFYL